MHLEHGAGDSTELIDSGAAGAEIGDHLGGDFGGEGRDPARRDAMIGGEHEGLNILPARRVAELRPGKGGQMVRAAGGGAQLMAREAGYALLRLPSGEMRRVLSRCFATIGQVGNLDHENENIGKAGRNRWKGWRPTVRGVVMNPVDHPHGGGEGRTSGGRHPVSPWGVPTKGKKTRNNSRTDKYIVRRRKKG